jgi:hypothetical protein
MHSVHYTYYTLPDDLFSFYKIKKIISFVNLLIIFYYICGMDLSKYNIEELIKLNHEIMDMINNYEDGHVYICKVRSYGRNWIERDVKNKYTLQDLLYKYDGEDGIVDVYSTNPDLCKVYNYGELMYINSALDFEKWDVYESMKNTICSIEKDLERWENRNKVPFGSRPVFEPLFTREDLDEHKKKLEEYDMSFIPPVPCKLSSS